MVLLNGCSSGTYTSDTGFLGTNSFTLIANDSQLDSAPFLVNASIIIGDPIPTAGNVNLTGNYGVPLTWTPVVKYAESCRIATPPSNGVASVASDCTTGSYTADIGFVGIDRFTYIAQGLTDSLPGTVTVAVTAPDTDSACTNQYPLKQTAITGKQGHLTLTVTGNIISVNTNGKEIKICPATTVSYTTSTNTPNATVVCRVKFNTGKGKGKMKVNDHIKCHDKPVGGDKIHVKIKSGVYKKAM